MEKILVVDDSEDTLELVRHGLKGEYNIATATTLYQARNHLSMENFDLIVLDITLPDGEGYELCNEIRANAESKNVPIIFLSGRAELKDKMMAFYLGGDDYLVKPFDVRELRLRVEAKLKRANPKLGDSDWYRKGDIKVNKGFQKAYYIDEDGEQHDLDLTPIEFKILLVLSSYEEHVFSRNKLMNWVWGQDVYLSDRTVDRHICSLRKKMGDAGTYIRSIYGSGYSFRAEERKANKKSEQGMQMGAA